MTLHYYIFTLLLLHININITSTHYCIIALLLHSIIAILHYYIIIFLYFYIIINHNINIISLQHYIIILLHQYIFIILLCYSYTKRSCIIDLNKCFISLCVCCLYHLYFFYVSFSCLQKHKFDFRQYYFRKLFFNFCCSFCFANMSTTNEMLFCVFFLTCKQIFVISMKLHPFFLFFHLKTYLLNLLLNKQFFVIYTNSLFENIN